MLGFISSNEMEGNQRRGKGIPDQIGAGGTEREREREGERQ